MRIEMKYGSEHLPLSLPDSVRVDIFSPNAPTFPQDPVAALHAALDSPLGCPPLEGRPTPRSVAIAVPDETRPFPTRLLLPPLLNRLFAAYPHLTGSDLTIVVGGGLHLPADETQLARILPDDLRGCRVVAHDANHSPITHFGVTSRGTSVEINAAYGEADLKIVMGMVDAHQFVGFTGGAKGVVVGCASAAMITANHRMLREEAASVGRIEDNPVRLDLNEAGEMVGVAFAVNVVLDATKTPVAVLAGRPPLVMAEAARQAARLYGLHHDEPYDIVIASCGGRPKDICLYQAQKGLATAVQCVKPGGRVLLLAECGQGIGNDEYHEYVKRFPDAQTLKKTFEAGEFKMGAHKAYLFAQLTSRCEVVLHTALAQQTLAECHLQGGEAQPTLNRWLTGNYTARVAVITDANSSFFAHK